MERLASARGFRLLAVGQFEIRAAPPLLCAERLCLSGPAVIWRGCASPARRRSCEGMSRAMSRDSYGATDTSYGGTSHRKSED
jgi:hypothetical protein